MKEIIDSPFSDGKAHLKSENTTSVYRNEKFSYTRCYYVCDETGLEFTEDETDEATFSQIYEQYAARHGDTGKISEKGLSAYHEIRTLAEAGAFPEMTLEEINDEIKEHREGR